MKKNLIIVTIIVFAIVLFFIIKPTTTGNAIESKTDLFAQCLTDSGAVMYGTSWCSHCQDQKELFGKSAFKKINFVDCDFKSEICESEGIAGYPTWKLDGESYSGVQSFGRLSQLTGCEY